MDKVLVIAPDPPSGMAFDAALRKKGVETQLLYADIEPRVVGQEMNLDPKVEEDLVRAINDGRRMDFNRMVIACNTLQLWINKAYRMMDTRERENLKIVTTFEAMRVKYHGLSRRPVWLGTWVLSRLIPEEYFPTLPALGLTELQNLVQEIIWRVKGVTGADVSTASKEITEIESREELAKRMTELMRGLKENALDQVVLGCTELPIGIKEFTNAKDKLGIELVDPAEVTAEYLLS